MENYIFSPKPNIEKHNKNNELAYYTLYGNHDFIDDEGNPRTNNPDSPDVLAKTGQSNRSNPSLYIKVGPHGRIFNPIGLYSEGKQKKFLSKIGKNEFEFTKVNQKVFNLYLNFLKTKNLAWLSNAEREMI